MEVFEVERMRKEIDNYIEHIIICHEKNDFEMMKEESISLLFWGSQMIEVNNTIRQRDGIIEEYALSEKMYLSWNTKQIIDACIIRSTGKTGEIV